MAHWCKGIANDERTELLKLAPTTGNVGGNNPLNILYGKIG